MAAGADRVGDQLGHLDLAEPGLGAGEGGRDLREGRRRDRHTAVVVTHASASDVEHGHAGSLARHARNGAEMRRSATVPTWKSRDVTTTSVWRNRDFRLVLGGALDQQHR